MNDLGPRLGRRRLAANAAATVLLGAAASQAEMRGQAAAAPAWQETPQAQSGATTVYVNGTGSVQVSPDLASVVIGVSAEQPTLAAAQSEATAQATAIIAAIRGNGVEEKDIQTTNFSVRIIRERERGEERGERTGFEVSYAVAVTVRALDTLGGILDDAITAGANDVRNIAFSLADPAAAANQARTRAMDDARAKADTLAAAAGMTVRRAISIVETYSPAPAAGEFAAATEDGYASPAVPIAVGTDEVVVEVDVTYEVIESL